MFKSRKNKNIAGPGVVDNARKNKDVIAAEAALYGKDLSVHVMPERFRSAKLSSKQAKKAGMLVLLVGGLFLITAVILVYYYILKPRLGAAPAPGGIAEAPALSEKPEAPAPAETPRTPAASEPEPEAPIRPEPTPSEEIPEAVIPSIIATTTEEIVATTSEVATSTEELPIKPPALPDLDRDGLSDAEERLLGSNIALPDSDGDGFDDLTELINLYNPAGAGKITESGVFSTYTNATYKYTLYYSPTWPIKRFGGDDSVMFEIDTVQFFQVIVQPNADKKPIREWFIGQFGESEYSPARALNKNGWEGIAKADGNIFYLTDDAHEYLITLSYNLGNEEVEHYKNIFELIINTFAIGG